MIEVTVSFPLRGEWVAAHTPGERVPSHGVDFWGQTYAYDFLQVDTQQSGFKFFRPSNLRYFLTGVTLKECFGYGEPIYAPFDGLVLEGYGKCPERNRLHPIMDLLRVLKNGIFFEGKALKNSELVPMLGNYLILQSADGIYALLAHLQPGSLKVQEGDRVWTGQELAQVGHTGNSTAPHLHFQLMDSADLCTAKGIPCAFKEYESFKSGTWSSVTGSIPGKQERIRA